MASVQFQIVFDHQRSLSCCRLRRCPTGSALFRRDSIQFIVGDCYMNEVHVSVSVCGTTVLARRKTYPATTVLAAGRMSRVFDSPRGYAREIRVFHAHILRIYRGFAFLVLCCSHSNRPCRPVPMAKLRKTTCPSLASACGCRAGHATQIHFGAFSALPKAPSEKSRRIAGGLAMNLLLRPRHARTAAVVLNSR